MRIVIASIFRNSTHYLGRYFSQVAALTTALEARGHEVSIVVAEGDSSDGTYEALLARQEQNHHLSVLKLDHGGPVFGSVDDKTRWRNISKVCNYLLNNIGPCDAMVYVESDLLWTPDTMLALLEDLGVVDAVAPMCFSLPTGKFYDTWGHRRNGVRFSSESPYHVDLDRPLTDHDRLPIDSAGSCIVMKGAVAAMCRFVPPEGGIVAFCEDIRGWGFSLYLNPHQRVYHP